MEKVEVEYENYNNRRENTGPDENDEATMLEKNVTNIESNSAKAETTETNGVNGGDNSGPNARPTEMDVVITEMGDYPNHMTAEVAEDDQYEIRSTGGSIYTEQEEAMDEDCR